MTDTTAVPTADPRRPALRITELVAMVGGLMALNALSIDVLLPALPEIGAAMGETGNAPQLVVTAYVFGFGVAQIFHGPLADAFGRRKVLLWSLAAYVAATLACVLAGGFLWLLAARILQGAAAAATRVVAMALVRDLVAGRRMAEVMSFVMTVFMVAPILAPGLGQLILFVGPWQWIFVALLAGGGGLYLWMQARLPETLPPDARSPLALGAAMASYAAAASDRITFGYMAASTLIFGALFAFIATAEQVMAQEFALGAWFPLAFAFVALGLAGANFFNARIVRRHGMRRISHTALVLFIAISAGHAALAASVELPFGLFLPLLTLGMMLFGMIGANFSALAMEPAGKRAGVTAALYGAATAMGGAVLGSVIGQFYDGSVTPLLAGQALLGAGALLIVLWTERGRLFDRTA